MKFTKEELDSLKNTTSLFVTIKRLIINAEQTDPKHKTKLAPLNELRNAFDHLMRVFSVKFNIKEIKDTTPEEYAIANLRKAYGHVYRAGYDVLDWLLVKKPHY